MSYPLKMINAVVIYHSGYGHTERMAAAVAEGASARLIPIDSEGNIAEEAWERISEADVILLGSPTYMGGQAGSSKNLPMHLSLLSRVDDRTSECRTLP